MEQTVSARILGGSELKVSPLGVGTNKWESGKNDERVIQAFNASMQAGVNFFDTAEMYGFGKSEKLLGACISQTSGKVVVSSKYLPMLGRRVKKALDASLSRLGLKTLDIYFVHFPIGNIDSLMDQMAHAFQDGKIRAVGVSNFSADQMNRAAERLARYNIPLAANEVHYNLFHRDVETNGVLQACRDHNAALVAYFPLISGRYKNFPEQKGSDQQGSVRKWDVLLEVLQKVAAAHGVGLSQVMLNWLLRRDEHIIPIPGTTSAEHALENAAALNWMLTEEEFHLIDQASAPAG